MIKNGDWAEDVKIVFLVYAKNSDGKFKAVNDGVVSKKEAFDLAREMRNGGESVIVVEAETTYVVVDADYDNAKFRIENKVDWDLPPKTFETFAEVSEEYKKCIDEGGVPEIKAKDIMDVVVVPHRRLFGNDDEKEKYEKMLKANVADAISEGRMSETDVRVYMRYAFERWTE